MDQRRVVRTRANASDAGPGGYYAWGSGYLVARELVLTAAHVLAETKGGSVEKGRALEVLRLGERGWHDGVVLWVDQEHDVALVRVDGLGMELQTVPFGHLVGTAPVNWTVVGFPHAGRGSHGRQEEQAWGKTSAVTQASSGRLGLTLESRQAQRPATSASGWAGLSGAAIFAGAEYEHLVGVITSDPQTWSGSLEGVRLEAFATADGFRALVGPLATEEVSGEQLVAEFRRLVSEVSVAASLPADYSGHVRNFMTTYLGRSEAPTPFAGRARELELLDSWLWSNDAPPYLLIAAPAGYGKSTLLVHWLTRVQRRQTANVAFMPVSLRFNTGSALVVFSTLAARLATIYGRALRPAMPASPDDWRGVVANYLGSVPPDGQPTLVVVDGLDEAADWKAGPELFPLDPPPGLRILAAARFLAGDQDTTGWLERLGWTAPGLAQSVSLTSLDKEGIGELLAAAGLISPVEGVNLVDKLYLLTEGDPLLAGLYVAHLSQPGAEGERRDLAADLPLLPPGLDGYFEQWFEQQRKVWGAQSPLREPLTRMILNVLAVAQGPIERDEFLAVEPSLDSWTLEESMRSLERFVIGNGREQGYSLSHPRLAGHFEQRLSAGEREAAHGRFATWGAGTLAKLEAAAPVVSPPPNYLSHHFADHLSATNAVERLFELSRNAAWANAQLVASPSGTAMLHDLHVAWRLATARNRACAHDGQALTDIAQEVNCALLEATLHSLSYDTPDAIVVGLVRNGRWTLAQALERAQMNPSQVARIRASVVLASLSDSEAERIALVRQALARIKEVDPERRGRADVMLSAFLAIAPHLPRSISTEAADFVRKHFNEEKLVPLIEIVSRFPDTTSAVMSIVRGELDRLVALWPFPKLLAAIPEECQAELLEDSLGVARSLPAAESNGSPAASVVARLACAAPPDRRAELAREALSLGGDDPFLITEVAGLLPEPDRSEAITKAIQAVSAIESDTEWAADTAGQLLEKLAPNVPPALIEGVLSAAEALKDASGRERAIKAIIPLLPRRLLGRALTIANGLYANGKLACQRLVVKRLLALGDVQKARHLAETIRYALSREGALADIAAALAAQGLSDEALSVIETITNDWWRFHALADVFDHVPPDPRRRVVDQIMSLVRGAEIQAELAGTGSWVSSDPVNAFVVHLAEKDGFDDAIALARLMPARAERGNKPRAEALASLVELAPHGSEALVIEEALGAVRLIDDHREQALALISLAGELPDPDCDEARRASMVAARAIVDPLARAQTLLAILDRLGLEQHPEALDEIVRCVASDHKELHRQEQKVIVGKIAGRLSPAQVEALLPLTDPPAQERTAEEAWEAWLIHAVGSALPPGLIGRVRERAEGVSGPESRVLALSGLLSALDPISRPDLIQTLFASVEALPVDDEFEGSPRARAVAHLAQCLDDTTIDRASALLDDVGRGSEDHSEALVALCLRLAQLGRADDAFDLVGRIEDDYARGRVLVHVISGVSESRLGAAAALADGLPGWGWTRADVTIALALRQQPSGQNRELLTQAVRFAAQPRYLHGLEGPGLTALRELAPRLTPTELADVIDSFSGSARPEVGAVALANLASLAPADRRDALLRKALDIVEKIPDSDSRGQALSLVAPRLANDMLARAAALATTIPSSGYIGRSTRAEALAALAPSLARLPMRDLQAIWEATLPRLAGAHRKELLLDLAALAPVVASLASPHGLTEVFRTYRDVLNNWP